MYRGRLSNAARDTNHHHTFSSKFSRSQELITR